MNDYALKLMKPPETEKRKAGQRKCRLLILDDNGDDRTVVRILLEKAPDRTWQFLEEEDGPAALRLLESTEVDCILLDYQLPQMNGIRFIHELSLRFGPLRFPVVMFTGSGRAGLAMEALMAGAQDHMAKDAISTYALLHAIDNAIDRVDLLRARETQRQELENANARLRLLEAAIQATVESVVITDAELEEPGPRIVFVNQAFTKMTGYSAEDVIGKNPRLLQGEKTDRLVLDRLRSDLTHGRPFSGETVNYRKDGSEFVMDWAISPIPGRDRRPSHYVAVQRDATERHQVGQKLRESEQRLDMALRGADLGIWDWDLASGRVSFNERWASMLGYSIDDVSQSVQGWASLVHPEDLPAAEQKITDHLAGRTTMYDAEFRMRTRDGKWRWVLSRGRVVDRRPDGQPVRAVGTHLDITDRRLAESALQRSNEDLQQFAYTVSHDLQEPLRMMLAFSELLERKFAPALDGDGLMFLRTIHEGAQRTTQLVADLLKYAKAGAQEQEEMTEPCALDEVLDAVQATFARRIAETGAVIERDPLPVVSGHRAQIEHLVQNLLSNALKYRAENRTAHIRISAQSENGMWVISVRDNGVGFPPEKSEYIFGVFKRLHGKDHSGTGIGLAICKRIIEQQGGSIWAESVPGEGATFHFRLPGCDQAFAAH